MQTYTIRRTGQAPLRLRGEIIAEAGSSPDRAHPRWSGSTGRWEEVTIYRTAKGKYVAAIKYGTLWQGETDTFDAGVFGTLAKAVEWLQYKLSNRVFDWLIEKLSQEEIAEDVD